MPDPTGRTHRRSSTRTPGRIAAFALAAIIASACGWSGDQTAASGDSPGDGGQTETPVASADSPPAPTGAIDQALAAQGAELFKNRGCVACHTFGGGRLVGPDLIGVTERRTFEWTYAMIINPDSMLANDETARALLAEYYTPMTNQNVQRDEALALYEHIRNQDAGGETAGD